MTLGSTLEIGTQIILLKIDGFVEGWILHITPLNVKLDLYVKHILSFLVHDIIDKNGRTSYGSLKRLVSTYLDNLHHHF